MRAADPPWRRTLFRHVLPLALLPSVAWPLGQAGEGVLRAEPGVLAAAFAATLVFSIATVLFLALGIYLLSPFFEVGRRWNAAVTVSAYASTPVLLSGVLLFIPMLVIAGMAALAYAFLLCDMGLQKVLGCRGNDAVAFVASACGFAAVAAALLGALCSAAGLI